MVSYRKGRHMPFFFVKKKRPDPKIRPLKSDSKVCLYFGKSEQQMRDRADDQKTQNGPLEEDEEELRQVDGELGFQDETAFVLVAGQHNAQRSVADPGCDAVHCGAPRQFVNVPELIRCGIY